MDRISLKVLELYSGTGVLAETFRKEGHDVLTLDSDPSCHADYCMDIFQFDIYSLPSGWKPDVVWASIPCTCFSKASNRLYWTSDGKPKNEKTVQAIKLAKYTIDLIKALEPIIFFIENPQGFLRKQDFMQGLPRKSITYCQYGETRQKPTDIWTNSSWLPRPVCRRGASCHDPAPRGSGGGSTKIRSPKLRAKLPQALCKEVVHFSEYDVWYKKTWGIPSG